MLYDGKLTDCCIDYLYAGKMDETDFDKFYKFQLSLGMKELEPPKTSLHGPSDKPETRRAVLGVPDGAGGIMLKGVIVNPPYPFAPGPGRHARRAGSRGLEMLAALAVGAALASVIRALRRRD